MNSKGLCAVSWVLALSLGMVSCSVGNSAVNGAGNSGDVVENEEATVTFTTYAVENPSEERPDATEAPTTTENAAQNLLDPQSPIQSIADDVVAEFGGVVGVAVAGPDGVRVGGDDGAYPAWSTIKVPIAIAATRTVPAEAEQFSRAAIQLSDNDSAQSLWEALPAGAADEVLAEGGVAQSVNKLRTRPEYSVFGQTALTVSQEATFASQLKCIRGAGPVISLMGSVDASQSYGLGELPGARFKGGWGPDTSGGYLVRQFGLASNSRGEDIAIALTAIPASGDYATGQSMLSAMARKLSPLLDHLPVARC